MMYLYMDIHHIENITVHKIYISYEAHLLQCIALHPKYGKVQTFQCIRLLKLYKWIKLSLNFIVFCYWQYLNKYYLIKLNLSPFFKTKSEFSIMNSNLGLFINNSIISSQLALLTKVILKVVVRGMPGVRWSLLHWGRPWSPTLIRPCLCPCPCCGLCRPCGADYCDDSASPDLCPCHDSCVHDDAFYFSFDWRINVVKIY